MATQTKQQIEEELAAIELQMKRLNLEALTDQVQTIKDKKEARRLLLQTQQRDLQEVARQKEMREADCRHRKGGKNLQGLAKGNDNSNYSVVQHTYPAGAVQVMCARCGKEWNNPPLALRASEPAKYKQDLAEYRAALEWPTDNEPSGTQLFIVTNYDALPSRAKPAA